MKFSKLRIILFNIFAVLFLLVLSELLIRLFYPEIKLPGTDYSLLKENVYYNTHGLNPNSKGLSRSELKFVDETGFWKYSKPIKTNGKKFLLLGDSVTMGIGLENDSTFAGIINNSNEILSILNTAVMGFSSKDYLNIVKKIIHNDNNELGIDRVIIGWCLNDIYSNLPDNKAPGFQNDGFIKSTIVFIRSNSKLYQFLKNLFTDRSKAYFDYDKQFYDVDNPYLQKSKMHLEELYKIASARDIQIDLVVFPYEYQVRFINNQNYQKPQQSLKRILKESGIKIYDAINAFENYETDSKDLFLFGDGIHFSNFGNRILAKFLSNELRLK